MGSCMCVYTHLCEGKCRHMCIHCVCVPHVCGTQTTLSVGPHLLSRLRQDSLFLSPLRTPCQPSSNFWRCSCLPASHLPIGVLELQRIVLCPAFMWVLGMETSAFTIHKSKPASERMDGTTVKLLTWKLFHV